MKRNYPVTITEKLEKVVEIEASSRNEAISIAKLNYYDSNPILSADDFTGVVFTIQRERQYER
jgi:hypothetical protein